MSSTFTHSQLCTITPMSHFCSWFRIHFHFNHYINTKTHAAKGEALVKKLLPVEEFPSFWKLTFSKG